MSRLPSLGPRGEGWVVIQIALLWLVVAVGVGLPGHPGSSAALGLGAVGLLLILSGGGLALAGLVELRRGASLTVAPRPPDAGRLVESGPYRYVRHPVYGGLVLAAVGWAALRASGPAIVAAVALFAFFDLKRRREEAWLLTKYPEYAAYRARTRRLLPWVW